MAVSTMREMQDRLEIRELIENWYIWRDKGDFDRLREIWLPDGRMYASWWEGPFEGFIEANKTGREKGINILHQPGGTSIEVKGNRAVSITKAIISQRAQLHGVWCDANAQSRHHDLWEKREGRWGLVVRDTIFDKDRLDPVTPGERITLDQTLLHSFPEGYRHLGYLQASIGDKVNRNKATLKGAVVEKLYAMGRAWLDGASLQELYPERPG